MKLPAPPTPQQSVLFVFIIVAISVGTWVSGLFPAPQSVLDRPYLRAADGMTGTTERLGTVEVASLHGYEVYRDHPTQGVFLVVDLRAVDVPTPLTYDATLIDGEGRSLQRHSASSCRTQQPGLPAPCQLAFEADPDTLAGSVLHIARNRVLGEREYLVVDLDIDDTRAAALRAERRHSTYLGEDL